VGECGEGCASLLPHRFLHTMGMWGRERAGGKVVVGKSIGVEGGHGGDGGERWWGGHEMRVRQPTHRPRGRVDGRKGAAERSPPSLVTCGIGHGLRGSEILGSEFGTRGLAVLLEE
jgi:hypothetical protein